MKKQIKNINLWQFKKLWRTKKALLEEDNKEIFEEILTFYWKKTHKPKWSVTRKDLADRVFSEYDRLYYSDNNWICKCITCWQSYPWREIQAGHYRTRWCLKYRFDIRQVYPQCYTCNVLKNGNYRNYKIAMDKIVWPKMEEVFWNDNELVEYKQWWYQEHIIERFNFIKNKLKTIWGERK